MKLSFQSLMWALVLCLTVSFSIAADKGVTEKPSNVNCEGGVCKMVAPDTKAVDTSATCPKMDGCKEKCKCPDAAKCSKDGKCVKGSGCEKCNTCIKKENCEKKSCCSNSDKPCKMTAKKKAVKSKSCPMQKK